MNIDINKKLNPIQSPCKECIFCTQYKQNMICRKSKPYKYGKIDKTGNPYKYWKIDKTGKCTEFEKRINPVNYISWDEDKTKNLLLNAMSAIAYTTINDQFTPQALKATNEFIENFENFKKQPDLPIEKISIVSKLEKNTVLKELENTEKLLKPLKEGDNINNKFRNIIFKQSEVIYVLFKK